MVIMVNDNYFKHSSSIVSEKATIGDGSNIWHFSHIREGAKIGKNVTIGQNVYIDKDVVIGDNCKIQNNVSIYDSVKLDDDVLDSVWDSTSGTNLSKAKAVVRFLDFYLNAGQLTNVEQDVNAGSETDSFTDLLAQRLSTYTNSMNRNRLAVYTMMTAPDVQISR